MSDDVGTPEAPSADAPADSATRLTALRACGAERFDPVRFHYLEALARRAAAQTGTARLALERRLAGALAAYAERHDQAQAAAAADAAGLAQRFALAADEIGRLQAAGDVRALRRLAARLDGRGRPSDLGELVGRLDRPEAAPRSPRPADAGAAPAAAPAELKALRQFRRTWTRLSVDRQLSRSQSRLPDKPGPLNSQWLVLRALQQMQDLSPACLERFMAYADALLWLDQAGADAARAPAPAREETGLSSKRRPRRRP